MTKKQAYAISTAIIAVSLIIATGLIGLALNLVKATVKTTVVPSQTTESTKRVAQTAAKEEDYTLSALAEQYLDADSKLVLDFPGGLITLKGNAETVQHCYVWAYIASRDDGVQLNFYVDNPGDHFFVPTEHYEIEVKTTAHERGYDPELKAHLGQTVQYALEELLQFYADDNPQAAYRGDPLDGVDVKHTYTAN